MINDNMRSKLRQLARRLEEIDGMLADPACASDMSPSNEKTPSDFALPEVSSEPATEQSFS